MLLLLEPYLGEPYYWGGEQPPRFDCSGAIRWAAGQLGIELPHYAKYQYQQLPKAEGDLQVGDLVFFVNTYLKPDWETDPWISHVGIYAGEGMFLNVNAAHGVTYSDLTAPYWRVHYYGAARLVLPLFIAPYSTGWSH